MRGIIAKVRAPFAAELSRIVGRADTLLYRRGRLDSSVDDLICSALIEQRDDALEGPPVWDLVEAYVAQRAIIGAKPASVVNLVEP